MTSRSDLYCALRGDGRSREQATAALAADMPPAVSAATIAGYERRFLASPQTPAGASPVTRTEGDGVAVPAGPDRAAGSAPDPAAPPAAALPPAAAGTLISSQADSDPSRVSTAGPSTGPEDPSGVPSADRDRKPEPGRGLGTTAAGSGNNAPAGGTRKAQTAETVLPAGSTPSSSLPASRTGDYDTETFGAVPPLPVAASQGQSAPREKRRILRWHRRSGNKGGNRG